jgi:hypothetical protein
MGTRKPEEAASRTAYERAAERARRARESRLQSLVRKLATRER